MDFEKALQDLRTEPVPESAMDLTMRELRHPRARRNFWPVTVAASLIAIAITFWPGQEDDQAWAAAVHALTEAKYVHLRVSSWLNSCEAWESGNKFRSLRPEEETRYDGRQLGTRLGSVWSARKIAPNKPELAIERQLSVPGFDRALWQIEKNKATPIEQRIGDKTYRVYKFRSASVNGSSDPNFHPTGDSHARWPEDGHVGFQVTTALVDPATDRIVRLQRGMEFDPGVPADYIRTYKQDDLSVAIDYPTSLPKHFFEIPENAFNPKESKSKVAHALHGTLKEAKVAGQKVSLKAVLYDGMELYAIWSGCPSDQNAPQRFTVNGKLLGPPADLRCLCTNKYRMPKSTRFCGMGEKTNGPIPDHVNLTLPVFAPDQTRPMLDNKGVKVGYFSKRVGATTFKKVPVIRIEMLKFGFYQTEFGQPYDLD